MERERREADEKKESAKLKNQTKMSQAPKRFNLHTDSVRQWLRELRFVGEMECMSVLQGKTLKGDKDADQLTVLVRDIKSGIEKVSTKANQISREFDVLFSCVEAGRWTRLAQATLQVTCHIRSLIQDCNLSLPQTPGYLQQQEEAVMEECAKLAQQADSFSRGGVLPSKVPMVNQLTFLGQSFSCLVDQMLGHFVQRLVDTLDNAEGPAGLHSAISSIISLGLDGDHMCYILAREGGLRALLDICRTESLHSAHSQALRALATVCCVPESIAELEREGGLELLTDILCDKKTLEATKGEAAGVIAQITSPCLEHSHHLGGFVDNMQDLVQALIDLCHKTSSHEVFLLGVAAVANLTFLDSLACVALLQCGAPSTLIQAARLHKAASLFAKDQIATVLANMAAVPSCQTSITEHGGIELLVRLLHERPAQAREQEVAACERVYQKAAIALTRLCGDPALAQKIIQLKGIPRLVQLCRDMRQRHNSDAVLVASLAALRKLCATCGHGEMSALDFQQLIQPRLMDSFLMCSHSDENFV